VTILQTGEVWLVNLDPTIGDEIQKTRPVIIVNAGHEKNLRLAIVVPVTAWHSRWCNNPFFLEITSGQPQGLKKRSAIDCFQIRTLSHQRFVRRLGRIEDREIASIKKSLALILDIESEHCL